MAQEGIHPYKGEVTLDEILAFRLEDPSTRTSSALINAVCESFERSGYQARIINIADDLDVDATKLGTAVSMLTDGFTLAEILREIRLSRMRELRAAHPYWTTDQLAQKVGLYDRSSLRRALTDREYKRMGKTKIGNEMRRFHAALLNKIENDEP